MHNKTVENISKLLKCLPKTTIRDYSRYCELSEGRAVITDGFKLLIYEDTTINESRVIDANWQTVDGAMFPNWQGVIPEGDYIQLHHSANSILTGLLNTLKSSNIGKDHVCLTFNEEGKVGITTVNDGCSTLFNPYVLIDYIKALPKKLEITGRLYDGVIVLDINEKYKIIWVGMAPINKRGGVK